MSLRKLVLSFSLAIITLAAGAQNPQDVLFTYAKDKVTVEEFERYFLKNINIGNQPVTPAKVREDLDLYLKFKLKIQDARDAGLDTVADYLREVEMYRDQLAKSHLYDKEVTEGLIREAYDRLQYEVAVSHILIAVKPKANPADTLVAWQKIKGMYDRILAGKNTFEAEAKNSDDPGTKDAGGNLGYMTALQVVYPFENMAYATPVGQISGIFRTDFGYHIIKVTDKRANRGDVKLRHILLRVGMTPEGTDEAQKKKIDDIYAKIKSGQATFSEMARNYSEDFNSRNNGGGGEMDFLNVTMFIGDLDKQNMMEKGFALKAAGDYTEPFKTALGWHLLQRVDVRPVPKFESVKGTIKNQVQNSARAQKSVDALVTKVKTENNFTPYQEGLNALINSLDTNFAKGQFSAEKLPEYPAIAQPAKRGRVYIKPVTPKNKLKDMVLFQLAGEDYKVAQFAPFLEANMKPTNGNNAGFVNDVFNEWVKNRCITYQDQHLEEKSPEFKHLYQEFREGILMFSRMQQLVWDKANTDTVGLKAYHDKNSNKYMWSDRFDCEVYLCADKNIMKAVAKQVKQGVAADSIRRTHTKKNAINLDYRIGKFELADTFLFPNKTILETLFSKPEYKAKKNKIYQMNQMGSSWVVVKVKKFIPAEAKQLAECRGHVANDYQTYLEKAWIDSLMSKYPHSINESILEQLSKKLSAK
jgi:peptidyl-prolyl cis-trans isomerase SurA